MTGLATVRRVRRRVLIEADLARLRRLRDVLAPVAPAGAPRALVVSLTQSIYQLKIEGILAKAIEREGLLPVALRQDNWIPQRYFDAFGVPQQVTLAQFDPRDEGEVTRVAGELLGGARSMDDVKAFSYRGVRIGRHLFSTISRFLHRGHLELDEPGVREELARLLPGSIRSALAGARLLDELQPALLVFNERNYTAEAPLSDLALERGVNVVQFVSAFQDDGLVFKRYTRETSGLHPRSLSDATWERVKAMPWTQTHDRQLDDEFERRYGTTYALARRNHEWTRRFAPPEIVAHLGLDSEKPTAAIFSHVLWDANMFYGRDLFPDQEEWLVETVRAACENDRVNWIVKLHPANVWKLRRDGVQAEPGEAALLERRLGTLPGHVRLVAPGSEISPRSVFDLIRWGVTIRGSVGVELPCFGVAALTAGTGFYAGRGFTVDSATVGEYLDRLRAIERVPVPDPDQVELARRHAWALFFARPARFTTFRSRFRSFDRPGHPLEQDLELCVRSRAELDAAPDLRSFGRWAVHSDDLDYVAPGALPAEGYDRSP